MAETVTIPARFNGPLTSGNGGYSAGVVAKLIGGPAEVVLKSAVPLDTALDVVRDGDGGVRLCDGETLIAEGQPAAGLSVEVPEPVGLEEARAARAGYRGLSGEVFSRCFVCGRDREDSFEVFAGPVADRDIVASTWVPPQWSADEEGTVQEEFIWAVLDCPTFFALYPTGDLPRSVLGKISGRVDGRVKAGVEYVVMAWPGPADGRKRPAGVALLTTEGETLAAADALLIEPR